MLKTNQFQNSMGIGNDWPRHLFNQSIELQECVAKIEISGYKVKSELLIAHRHRNQHWSKQLFSSAKTGLKPYDKLVVIRDSKILCEYEFRSSRSEIFIGSNRIADVVLEGSKVSDFHAKVSCINGKFQIEDLGSEYGSYLNGKKIFQNEAVALQNGSLVRIMEFQILFILEEEQSVSTPLPDTFETKRRFRPGSVLIKFEQDSIYPSTSNLRVGPLGSQSWQKGATELRVTDIIDETHDVKTFRLTGVIPIYFSYMPGQFVTLFLNINGKEVQRSYSMSSSPSRPHTLDLTVKRVPGGLVSNWLCDHVKPGDILKVKGPAGRFSCLHKPAEKLLFIGAGSGITPLMSMSRWLLDTASRIDAKVLFSFRNREDVIFRRELEMMTKSVKTVDIAVTLTGKQGSGENWNGFYGRIDSAMLRLFAKDLDDREVFLCGPEAFMNDVKSLLKTLNYPMEHLHCESFGNTKNYPETQLQTMACESKIKTNKITQTTNEGVQHTVTFAKSNKVILTDEKTNLLQLAEAEGIEIDFNCRTGSCAECMVKCLSGQAKMNEDCEIDDHEREQGWIFSCCAFAHSDLVINA